MPGRAKCSASAGADWTDQSRWKPPRSLWSGRHVEEAPPITGARGDPRRTCHERELEDVLPSLRGEGQSALLLVYELSGQERARAHRRTEEGDHEVLGRILCADRRARVQGRRTPRLVLG